VAKVHGSFAGVCSAINSLGEANIPLIQTQFLGFL
jgi:hypothetical protein